MIARHAAWWVLLAIVLLTGVMRYGLLEVPLERDEGEYAYAGQLLLEGIPPYQQLYSMKLPGVYVAYAVILAVFGQTHVGIHWGLLLVNVVTIALVFLLARRLVDALAGVGAAASFALLAVGPSVQGVFANAEHFVMLAAVGGLLLLVWSQQGGRQWLLFCGGLLLGLGVLMKQHGAAFAIAGGAYLVVVQLAIRPLPWRRIACRCALFAVGVFIPYGLTCVLLFWTGVFDNFWFWTVDYAWLYASSTSHGEAWTLLRTQVLHVVASAPLLWVLAGVGLTTPAWDERVRRQWIFVGLFVLLSLAAIFPGFHFRPHYFVLILPAAALLAGTAISAVADRLSQSPICQYEVRHFPSVVY